ncbi:hypothetical protein [Clavibacter michiganensis]|uniref:hypothetical protein n=1 Tax=Clavibacter michiganensis TaxID=28447 RepID=UPI00117F5798|nr:hypothetical protein [Clavibacter michiganensis]
MCDAVTLITWAITDRWAILASDRRLTWLRGGKPYSFEDTATKSFVLNGQLLMGYTGVAQIEGMSTEQWVLETLNGVLPNHMPQRLADAMNEYYRKTPAVRNMPHHFRMLGFVYNPNRSPAKWPIGYEVGNAGWALRGDRVGVAPVHGPFSVRVNIFGNRRHAVGAVGGAYSYKRLRELEREVKTSIRANPDDPTRLFDRFVEFTRDAAGDSGGTIGETVLLTHLPIDATPMREIAFAIPVRGVRPTARPDVLTAVTYPEGGTESVMRVPAFIYPDMAAMDFTLSPQPPDGEGSAPGADQGA